MGPRPPLRRSRFRDRPSPVYPITKVGLRLLNVNLVPWIAMILRDLTDRGSGTKPQVPRMSADRTGRTGENRGEPGRTGEVL